MVAFNAITKQQGSKILFAQASFQINPGEKIGLVGPNGAGKTTVFRLLMGEESPDQGAISKPDKIRIGYFSQNIEEMKGRSVLAEVLSAGNLESIKVELVQLEDKMQNPDLNEDEMMRVVERYGDLHGEFEAMGGYDDRDEEQKDNETGVNKENAYGDALASGIIDYMPGIFTAPEPVKDAILYGVNYGAYLARDKEEYGDKNLKDYQREVGKLVPVFENRGEGLVPLADMVGVFGTPIRAAIDVTETLEMLDANADDLTEGEKSFITASAVMDVMSVSGLAPADLKFAVKKRAREILRRRSGKETLPKHKD